MPTNPFVKDCWVSTWATPAGHLDAVSTAAGQTHGSYSWTEYLDRQITTGTAFTAEITMGTVAGTGYQDHVGSILDDE